jgi:catechol 2,3-dioxygenase-like lactoylglutathione lyase family enzyme
LNSKNRASWASTTLEVGDIDEALAFYGRLFRFELRDKSDSMAFSTWAISLSPFRRAAGSPQTIVATSVSSSTTRISPQDTRGRWDFRDLWGNRVEIVGYDNIQFTKAPNVLRGMGLMHLAKNEKAKKELAEKGMALE